MAKSRTKRTTISRTLADKLSQKLEQLPAKQKTELTPKEFILENSEQLDSALERGYDYDDLVALLKEDGIKLSKTTLRQYLNEARKTRTDQTADRTQQRPEPAETQPEDTPAETIETTEKRSLEETKRLPKKLGKGRLQSDENSARYPDGQGHPIEMRSEL